MDTSPRLFVDEARHAPGGGAPFARLFTDGPHDFLHAQAQACGIPKAAYRKPELCGARVVRGGYYLVTPTQRRAVLRAGAVRVSNQPRDLQLASLLIIAQVEVPRAGV